MEAGLMKEFFVNQKLDNRMKICYHKSICIQYSLIG